MKQAAEDEINVQLIEARKKIQKDSGPLAQQIMEKVLERSINP